MYDPLVLETQGEYAMKETDRPLLEGHQLDGGGSSELVVDGTQFLNFAGCNYLALTHRAELRDAAQSVLDSGVPFSRYLGHAYGGSYQHFDAVEHEAAKFFGTEDAVYLPSGYMIGSAAFAAAAPEYDVILLDEMAHWCLADAARLTGKPIHRFSHRSPVSLKGELDTLAKGQRPIVVTDGAFATFGALPPLDEYALLIEPLNGKLIVDESHAAGVVGPLGRGAAQHFDVENISFVGTTLSKAFCGEGAVYIGSSESTARVRASPVLRGSNSGSPISASVCAAALKLVRQNPDLCSKLRVSADYLRARLRDIGLEVLDTPTSIVSFSYGSFADMLAIQTQLFEQCIYVLHSNYIGAGEGGAIRLSIFADHSVQDLDRVAQAIEASMNNSS